MDNLVVTCMKSSKVSSPSKNKTKYHKGITTEISFIDKHFIYTNKHKIIFSGRNNQDKKDKEHKRLKKIRSKDVVDIFLNKAVGDFHLCELTIN